MIIYQFSLHHLYISLWKGWENALFELGSERVSIGPVGHVKLTLNSIANSVSERTEEGHARPTLVHNQNPLAELRQEACSQRCSSSMWKIPERGSTPRIALTKSADSRKVSNHFSHGIPSYPHLLVDNSQCLITEPKQSTLDSLSCKYTPLAKASFQS